MSTSSTEVFVDLPVLLDYCRTHVEECEPTREMLDHADKQNAYIEMSQSAYDFWEQSVLNMQSLLNYLKNKVNKYSLEEDYDNPGQKFMNDVLTLEHLNNSTPIGYEIKSEYNGEIETHIEYINEEGFSAYRGYLDTHLKNCSRAHSKLDDMIDNRYGPGGVDRFWIKNGLDSFSQYSQHLSSLVDGHYWCKAGGDLFLVRDGDRASYELSELKEKLKENIDEDVIIACPSQVLASISQ